MLKNTILLFVFISIMCWQAAAQVFAVEPIVYNGAIKNCVNLVILGDGFTSTEQDTFIKRARIMTNYYFNTSPWNQYKNYYNVFAIKVISNESGAKHPGTVADCPNKSEQPIENPDNYFGSTFDGFGMHRLIVVGNAPKVAKVLATNFPDHDQVVILVNTPYYGGSGGEYTFVSSNIYSNDILCHEVGHSFGGLSDEYWAGETYAAESPNMTRESNPKKVKWKGWEEVDTCIGACQYPGAKPWYKPSRNCKMLELDKPFCSVCRQTIIEKIHSKAKTLIAYSPSTEVRMPAGVGINFSLDTLLKPEPNTIRTVWQLDGKVQLRNYDAVKLDPAQLVPGKHTLIVDIRDTNSILVINKQLSDHFTHLKWDIDNTNAAYVSIKPTLSHVTFTTKDNLATGVLDISVKVGNNATLALYLYDSKGKYVKTLTPAVNNNNLKKAVDKAELGPGLVYVCVTIDGIPYYKQVDLE